MLLFFLTKTLVLSEGEAHIVLFTVELSELSMVLEHSTCLIDVFEGRREKRKGGGEGEMSHAI